MPMGFFVGGVYTSICQLGDSSGVQYRFLIVFYKQDAPNGALNA